MKTSTRLAAALVAATALACQAARAQDYPAQDAWQQQQAADAYALQQQQMQGGQYPMAAPYGYPYAAPAYPYAAPGYAPYGYGGQTIIVVPEGNGSGRGDEAERARREDERRAKVLLRGDDRSGMVSMPQGPIRTRPGCDASHPGYACR